MFRTFSMYANGSAAPPRARCACAAQVAVAVAGRPDSRVTCTGACRPATTCPARCRVEAPPAPLVAGLQGTLRGWRADRFANRISEVRLSAVGLCMGSLRPLCAWQLLRLGLPERRNARCVCLEGFGNSTLTMGSPACRWQGRRRW